MLLNLRVHINVNKSGEIKIRPIQFSINLVKVFIRHNSKFAHLILISSVYPTQQQFVFRSLSFLLLYLQIPKLGSIAVLNFFPSLLESYYSLSLHSFPKIHTPWALPYFIKESILGFGWEIEPLLDTISSRTYESSLKETSVKERILLDLSKRCSCWVP